MILPCFAFESAFWLGQFSHLKRQPLLADERDDVFVVGDGRRFTDGQVLPFMLTFRSRATVLPSKPGGNSAGRTATDIQRHESAGRLTNPAMWLEWRFKAHVAGRIPGRRGNQVWLTTAT